MSTLLGKMNPVLQEHLLKSQGLKFACSIVHNATAASKTFSSDIPGVCLLRASGLTAAVDAIESLTWTTATDDNSGSSVFGLYLNLGTTLTASPGSSTSSSDFADKVYSVSVVDTAGKTLTVTAPNANAVVSNYLTPLGNIAIEISAAALNLKTTDDTFYVSVDYREAKP